MSTLEAQFLCDLEHDGLLTAASLASYIGVSEMTARRRMACGGLSLDEAELLVSRHPNIEVAKRVLDHLTRNTDAVAVWPDDGDLDQDALASEREALRDAARVLGNASSTLEGIAAAMADDGVIDSREADPLTRQCNEGIRLLFALKAKLRGCGQRHPRKQARPFGLAK